MKLRIGGHISFSNTDVSLTIKRAVEIGANTIQIFGASPVQWKALAPNKEKADEFKALTKKYDINPVFLHAPYLINIVSPKDRLATMSRVLLEKHLIISNVLGAFGVIFHIGTRGDTNMKDAENKVISSIKKILLNVKTGHLIIENTAGAGNLVGKTLEELGRIIKGVNNDRLGICYDTAHGFESGVLKDGSVSGINKFVEKFDKYIGKNKLWAIHTNDSKTIANSNKDRHENIGYGYLGDEFFRNILHNKTLQKVPFILEVPGINGNGTDKENINKLYTLAK